MKVIPPMDMPYKELEVLNFYRRASADWRSKHFIDTDTHKVTTVSHPDWTIPWDMVNNDPKRNKTCIHCQDIFQMYHIVPPFCSTCWKVVVKPQKHSELIKLRNVQRAMVGDDASVWCKCGIELRQYVPGLYGGYFYTDSKEAGLSRLQQVRGLVRNHIGDIPVVLKRYCTEFEKELGDSAKYKAPENAEAIQQFYLSQMAETELYRQPKLVKMEVYHGWLGWGWKFGTPEDRKEIEDTYNEGQPLYPKPRTYED